TTLPFKAAAVTIAGLMSKVRPPGLPCRPMKLRFDDEAEISRPFSLSGFIARHMEQPASRHSKPASLKISCNPSCSASLLTSAEPGTTRARIPDLTFLPLAIFAAARRSVIRELVQEPTKATLIGVPRIGSPGCHPICSYAFLAPSGSEYSSGFGSFSEMPTAWPGLIPQVTVGSISFPSKFTTSSYLASESDATDFQYTTARSNASPVGT